MAEAVNEVGNVKLPLLASIINHDNQNRTEQGYSNSIVFGQFKKQNSIRTTANIDDIGSHLSNDVYPHRDLPIYITTSHSCFFFVAKTKSCMEISITIVC